MRCKRTAALIAALVVCGVLAAAEEAGYKKEEFRAFVATSDVDTLRTVSSGATIAINRLTTDVELGDLVAAFNAGGQEAFLRVLKKIPKVGYFRKMDEIGYDLQVALIHPLADGGRDIFLATDRPIGFGEAYEQSRSTAYPFTVIELRLGKDNRGDGTIANQAKITVSMDGKFFDVENYGPFPVLLKSVHKTK